MNRSDCSAKWTGNAEIGIGMVFIRLLTVVEDFERVAVAALEQSLHSSRELYAASPIGARETADFEDGGADDPVGATRSGAGSSA